MGKNVLLTAAVAERAGVDVATAGAVVSAMVGLVRDMALHGEGMRLEGVGRFVLRDFHGVNGPARALSFEPVGKMRRLPHAAP